MYIWDPSKYSSTLTFPVTKPIESYTGSVYSTLLPAGICEINGTRQESYTTTEFTATKEFVCDWKQRFEYIEVLRETVYNFESFTYVSGLPGDEYHPVSGSLIENSYWNHYMPAFAQDIRVQPFGAEGVGYEPVPILNQNGEWYYETNIQKYTKARITVSYKGLSRLSSATLDQTLTPQVTYRKLPPFGYLWLSDGAQVLDKEAPGKQETKLKIQRTLNNIRSVPDVFFDLAGCVNDAPVVDWLSEMTFPAGTLLYMPTNMTKRMTSAIGDDDRLWNFSFELNYNPIGWNRFQRPHGIDTMTFCGTPVELYPYADFGLFGLNEQLGAVNEDDQRDQYASSPLTALYEDYHIIFQDVRGVVHMLKVEGTGRVVLVKYNMSGSSIDASYL